MRLNIESVHRGAGTVRAYSDLVIAQKRNGHRGAVVHIKHGDSLSTNFGRWMRRTQIVDKALGRYRKLVTERDGTVLRDVDEPLSIHRGYGSASANNVPAKLTKPKRG